MKYTSLIDYMKENPKLQDEELAESYLNKRKVEESENANERLSTFIKDTKQTLLPINQIGGVKGVFYKYYNERYKTTEYIHIYDIDDTNIYYNGVSINHSDSSYYDTFRGACNSTKLIYDMINDNGGELSSLQEYFQVITQFVIGRDGFDS